MGPGADQAESLLLTFKTKIEEAVSLVHQMPGNMRLDAWQFWQKVSTAIKAASIGIKKRKPVPGGKGSIGRPRGRRKKNSEPESVTEQEEEEVVEEFVLEPVVVDPLGASPLTSADTAEIPEDQSCEFSQDLKLLYTSVYPNVTTEDTVAASNLVQSEACSVVGSTVGDVISDGADINIVIKSVIEHSQLPIEEKKILPQKIRTPRKRKKKDEQNSDEGPSENQESTANVTETDTEVGEKPLVENTSVNKKKPRRSKRPPKPRKLINYEQTHGSDADGEQGDTEAGVTETPRRKRAKPGEPKAEKGPVTCPECNVQLAFITSLSAHMRKHTGDRPFACTQCKKTFTTKANMLRHEKTHSGEKPFECGECKKCFTEKKTLKVHMRCHTGERPFKCMVCGVGFSQSGTLKTHMYIHEGHKGNLCDFCGRSFRQKSQLRAHQKRHLNVKNFKCDHCDQQFFSRGDLIRHAMKHSGEKPFACDQCPKRFTRMQYLREHTNQHTGNMPYSCSECNTKFFDSSSHNRHMQRHKKTKAAAAEEPMHLLVETNAIENDAADNIPALLVTSDHLQHLFGVNNANNMEVYRIALVDQAMEGDQSQVTQADFSAINLLANATTQLTENPTDADLKATDLYPVT